MLPPRKDTRAIPKGGERTPVSKDRGQLRGNQSNRTPKVTVMCIEYKGDNEQSNLHTMRNWRKLTRERRSGEKGDQMI